MKLVWVRLSLVILSVVPTVVLADHASGEEARYVDDCSDVPRDFRKAAYPYAQAPDGCSGVQSPREVRDSWGPVNFKPTCDEHDRCYYTLGSDWKGCNEAFRKNLLKACHDGLKTRTRVLGRPITLPPDPVRLEICYTIAHGYYAGVQLAVAANVFKDAQRKQRSYHAWITRCPNHR